MSQDKEVYSGYLIESLLAQGPVTVVYSAIDLASGLPCVIKTVRLDYPYEKQALAFLKSMQLAPFFLKPTQRTNLISL